MKKKIRLTESDLHKIVKESVNRIMIEEGAWDNIKAGIKAGIGGYRANKEVNSRYNNFDDVYARGGKPNNGVLARQRFYTELNQAYSLLGQIIGSIRGADGPAKDSSNVEGSINQLVQLVNNISTDYKEMKNQNNYQRMY